MTGGISCNGTQVYVSTNSNYEHVEEVYVNGTAFHPGDPINATCQFREINRTGVGSRPASEYLWYYDGVSWYQMYYSYDYHDDAGTYLDGKSTNRSFAFNVNATEGIQAVRCNINYDYNTSNFCNNNTANYYDTDDVNFTVVTPLNYTYWNITFTNGTVINDGANLTRIDSVMAAANWSKNLSSALVRHNASGALGNYTIKSSFPENWTNYTLNFSNATEFRLGLINISYIWANDSFNLDNSTSQSHYFYLWGFSKVDQVTSNQTTLYNSTPVRALCKVIDNITSQGINNSNVSFYGNDNFLNWSLTNSTGYANLSFIVNATSLPSNYTIKCNVTDQPSLYYNASSQNSNSTNITVQSPYYIQVGNFWFDYLGNATNVTNLFANLTIYANVTDTLAVSGVYANFSYPGGATNLSMSGDNTSAGWHLWNYTFNNSQFPLNATGTYTVSIIANNSNGIWNVSSYFLSFNISNNYTLNLTSNYTAYMRGENITVQVWDVNNLPVYDLNWTANLTRFNQTTNTTSYTNANYTYTIADDDPEGNYTLSVNVSKNNNTANSSWQFNVSKNLSLTLSTNPSSTPLRITAVAVSANLYNARNELYNSSTIANISCDSGSSWSSLNFSSGQASYPCTAPSGYNTPFNITINVTDNYTNTGENYTTLTTEVQQVVYTSGGGGGGGPISTTVKKCSDNTTYDTCNAKKRPYYCSNGTMIQNCGTCGCIDSNYSCQSDGSCILVREGDFNFTLSSERIEIEQGGDGEVKGLLTNTGNKKLSLLTFVNVSDDCCNVSIPQNITLDVGENTLSIPIHIPIFTSVGTYDIKIGIGIGSVKKEKIITASVIESHYYGDLSEINSSLDILEKQVQDYSRSGIDTGNLGNLIGKSKTLLASANSSISNDDVKVLASSLSEAANNARYVTTSLNNLIMKKFMSDYSWLIIALIISILSTLYLVPEVFMPLYKIDKDMRKLKGEEKDLVASRIETEKQYFMRKIDENTFSKIMITKQDRILRVRGIIKNQEESIKNILENRLKPKGIAMTLKQSITKVFKKKSEN